MKKIFRLTLLFQLLFAVFSCDDHFEGSLTSGNDHIDLSSNFIKFSSIEDFENTTNKLPNMTEEELDNWEKSNNFKSYRSVLKEAYRELDSITTQEGESVFLNKYKDVLYFQDGRWIPHIEVPLYQAIVNRDGIYETNGYLNRIIGDSMITVKNDDDEGLSILKDADSLSMKLLNKKGDQKIFQYISPQHQMRVLLDQCYTDMTASYFHNHSKCRDDRKVFINAKSYISFYSDWKGDWRQPRVAVKVWAERRRGTWCSWTSYATTLSYRNVKFDIVAWETQSDGTSITKLYSKDLPDYAPTNDRIHLTWDQVIGDRVLNRTISAYPFNRFHGEGSSRGVNNNWAVLGCSIIY